MRLSKNPLASKWRSMGTGLEPYVKNLYTIVAGSDEVGVGACAGPVVAGAVILPLDYKLANVKDSKAYSSRSARERAAELVKQEAIAWAVGVVSVPEMERINNNIRSGYEAHRRAVEALLVSPNAMIIDGEFNVPGLDKIAQYPAAKADQTCISVSAASVIAKVFRDNLMSQLSVGLESYGWNENAGYMTEQHIAAVKKFGLTQWHRHYFCKKTIESTNLSLYPVPTPEH